MFAALATALLICAGSVVCGQAILGACGHRELTWLAGPVGLAALVTVAGATIDLPGHATTTAIALAVTIAISAVALARRRPAGLRAALPVGVAAAALAALLAAIPFIVAGRVGILGVGLVNDDMASHLLLADWLDARFHPDPVLVRQGYPLGPHALMAALAAGPGPSLIEAFAGLVLAIPALTALVAAAALREARPSIRVAVSALVALPYMAAAYLAQEAFKEPIEALFVLGFALLLPTVREGRAAIPLGVIAAGSVYAYSFPGLLWLGLSAAVLGALELARRRTVDWRAAGVATAAAVATVLVLTLPDWGRIADFTHFRAFDPNRANEGGLGNLHGYLSPLEALGVWPTSEFRLAAGEGSLPAAAFYLGAVLGAGVLVAGGARWTRRNGPAVLAALVAAALIYLVARAFGTVYTSAKALAIAAPLVVLLGLGGLAAGVPRGRAAQLGLAAAFAAAALLSSFLVLRQAPVGPSDHADELARLRPLVAGRKLLFLGRDNFVLYELRGSRPYTHVRNFYDPYFVKPDFRLRDVGSKFDFDAVRARTLARFPYVITTRAPYASGPPPAYQPVATTPSYVLWHRRSPGPRAPVEDGPPPGASVRCPGAVGGGRVAVFDRPPVGPVAAWSPSTTLESGARAKLSLSLPRGRWQLSLQYDATRPVTLTAPGYEATLPGNLDYRGVAPYWPAGEIDVPRTGLVTVTATVESPAALGRLLGARSVAHLGALAATPAGPGYVPGLRSPAPGAAERIVGASAACGRYGDWAASQGG